MKFLSQIDTTRWFHATIVLIFFFNICLNNSYSKLEVEQKKYSQLFEEHERYLTSHYQFY